MGYPVVSLPVIIILEIVCSGFIGFAVQEAFHTHDQILNVVIGLLGGIGFIVAVHALTVIIINYDKKHCN